MNNIDVIPELQKSLITGCIDGSTKSLEEQTKKEEYEGVSCKNMGSNPAWVKMGPGFKLKYANIKGKPKLINRVVSI